MSGMEPTARQSEGYVWIISDIIFFVYVLELHLLLSDIYYRPRF